MAAAKPFKLSYSNWRAKKKSNSKYNFYLISITVTQIVTQRQQLGIGIVFSRAIHCLKKNAIVIIDNNIVNVKPFSILFNMSASICLHNLHNKLVVFAQDFSI